MRMPLIALFITSLLFLSSVERVSVVAPAAAQTPAKAQPQSKEALYLKCRNAIFRKYGQPGVQYNHGPRYRVLPYTSVSQIDQCVANGGRADRGGFRGAVALFRRLRVLGGALTRASWRGKIRAPARRCGSPPADPRLAPYDPAPITR